MEVLPNIFNIISLDKKEWFATFRYMLLLILGQIIALYLLTDMQGLDILQFALIVSAFSIFYSAFITVYRFRASIKELKLVSNFADKVQTNSKDKEYRRLLPKFKLIDFDKNCKMYTYQKTVFSKKRLFKVSENKVEVFLEHYQLPMNEFYQNKAKSLCIDLAEI